MPKPDPIIVPDELHDPHHLVVISLPLLRQAKEIRENLIERETCLNITVQTHALKDRAVRIMDTLLKALEAHGYVVEVTSPRPGQPDTYGRRTDAPSATLARIGETVIQFGIHEGTDHVAMTPKQRRGIFDTYGPRTEYKEVPNGKLSLCIHSHHWRSRFNRRTSTHGQRQRVENCLGTFLQTVANIAEESASKKKGSVAKSRRNRWVGSTPRAVRIAKRRDRHK